MPEKEVYQEKKVAPVSIVVAQKASPEEEDFTDDQKIEHQAFYEDKKAQFEQEDSVMEGTDETI